MSYFRYIYKNTYLLSPVYIASSKNVCQTPCAPYALRLTFPICKQDRYLRILCKQKDIGFGVF